MLKIKIKQHNFISDDAYAISLHLLCYHVTLVIWPWKLVKHLPPFVVQNNRAFARIDTCIIKCNHRHKQPISSAVLFYLTHAFDGKFSTMTSHSLNTLQTVLFFQENPIIATTKGYSDKIIFRNKIFDKCIDFIAISKGD